MTGAGAADAAGNLLALDTSSDACSVALKLGGAVIERHVVEPRKHTGLLVPMIEGVLEEGETGIEALDAVVAGVGPGSFIGVRIAVSVAQGMALAAGLGIVPVSSLAAVAAEFFATTGGDRVAVAQDAHRNEVYFACFERDRAGLPRPRGETRLAALGPLPELQREPGGWFAAGAAWRRRPELLEANRAWLAGVSAIELPRARFLLPTAVRAYRAGGAVAPDDVDPAYVRDRVAAPG